MKSQNQFGLHVYSGENKKLTWFFTQKPKTVIQTIVNYSLENPAEKEKTKSETKAALEVSYLSAERWYSSIIFAIAHKHVHHRQRHSGKR